MQEKANPPKNFPSFYALWRLIFRAKLAKLNIVDIYEKKGGGTMVFETLFGEGFALGAEEEERYCAQEQEKEKAGRVAAFFKDNIAEDWDLHDPREDDYENY